MVSGEVDSLSGELSKSPTIIGKLSLGLLGRTLKFTDYVITPERPGDFNSARGYPSTITSSANSNP